MLARHQSFGTSGTSKAFISPCEHKKAGLPLDHRRKTGLSPAVKKAGIYITQVPWETVILSMELNLPTVMEGGSFCLH